MNVSLKFNTFNSLILSYKSMFILVLISVSNVKHILFCTILSLFVCCTYVFRTVKKTDQLTVKREWEVKIRGEKGLNDEASMPDGVRL